MTDWNTAEPPWLAQLHPDLVEDEQPAGQDGSERTPEERAAWLVEQLERATAGRVPPALAGEGWREAPIAEYQDTPAQPVLRQRQVGPWKCQTPPKVGCPDCGRKFPTKTRLAVHAVQHRRDQERAQASHKGDPSWWVQVPRPAPAKPQPGARRNATKRQRRQQTRR